METQSKKYDLSQAVVNRLVELPVQRVYSLYREIYDRAYPYNPRARQQQDWPFRPVKITIPGKEGGYLRAIDFLLLARVVLTSKGEKIPTVERYSRESLYIE